MTTATRTPVAVRRSRGWRLRDGRCVHTRPLRPSDAAAVAAFFAAADPIDLRRRFLGQPPPLSRVAAHIVAGDGIDRLALGAFDEAGTIVGIAEFDRIGDTATAELAIEVATPWQHGHLGTILVRRLGRVARSVGIERFTAVFFADNIAIRRLLRRAGAGATTFADGEGHLTLELGRM